MPPLPDEVRETRGGKLVTSVLITGCIGHTWYNYPTQPTCQRHRRPGFESRKGHGCLWLPRSRKPSVLTEGESTHHVPLQENPECLAIISATQGCRVKRERFYSTQNLWNSSWLYDNEYKFKTIWILCDTISRTRAFLYRLFSVIPFLLITSKKRIKKNIFIEISENKDNKQERKLSETRGDE